MGNTWVHLRLCLTCGHVGCCGDSKNRHATKHLHALIEAGTLSRRQAAKRLGVTVSAVSRTLLRKGRERRVQDLPKRWG
jgi:transposase